MARKADQKSAFKSKCVDTNCSRRKQISLQETLIAPFEGGTEDTKRLFSYFLHKAPDVESVHSQKIPVERHSALFALMMDARHFEYQRFCSANTQIKGELERGGLNGETLCFKCKRFVCKKAPAKKGTPTETDLNCFVRHIRNSIAHGRVHYSHNGNRIHIVFEDITPSTGNISARIVCIKADLEHWKKVLSNPANYQ